MSIDQIFSTLDSARPLLLWLGVEWTDHPERMAACVKGFGAAAHGHRGWDRCGVVVGDLAQLWMDGRHRSCGGVLSALAKVLEQQDDLMRFGHGGEALGMCLATLKRDWEYARAWLFAALRE